jgi:hypothetical protein
MDKYTLLLILNIPFVLFGAYKALMLFRTSKIDRISFVIRFLFWLVVLTGLIFSENTYDYLTAHGLTDSTPLSLPDVVLVTGVVAAIFMCFRLYARIDLLESRLTQLNEKISILVSTELNKKN